MGDTKKGFSVKSYWVSIQNAEIRDIALNKKRWKWEPPVKPDLILGFSYAPKAQKYNPFDYYYNPVPDYIVIDILGDRINLQSIPLYTLFASLDPNNHEQILKFCYYFGLPRYLDPYPQKEYINVRDNLFMEDFLHEECFLDSNQEYWHLANLHLVANDIIGFKTYLYFTQEISKGNTISLDSIPQTDLDALLASQRQNIVYYDDRDTPSMWIINRTYCKDFIKDLEDSNDFLLEDSESFLEYVYPSLNYEDKSFNLKWNFANLISAMYFMLALDLSANKVPVQCLNPLCKRYFIPQKTGALYCSDTCQNRAKQQRYRAKMKHLKEGE